LPLSPSPFSDPPFFSLFSVSTVTAMSIDELKSGMEEHVDLMSDLVQKISSQLRYNLRPAKHNFLGFFLAIHWKVFLSILLNYHITFGVLNYQIIQSLPFCLFQKFLVI
jgi:transmembrane protein 18